MARWQTPQDFLKSTLGNLYDMDGGFPKKQPYQCWDYGDFFWVNQVGRALVTKAGGNGCAKDCWNISKVVNAGNEFDLIYDKNQLLVGDWIITGNGTNGHIGIVAGITKVGSVVLLQSENNGSVRVNRKDYNISQFLGAFRYKDWHKDGIGFLPAKGYWKFGDRDKRIDTLCRFYADTFYGYFCKSKAEAHRLLDGNYFGNNCLRWTKEFQKRAKADGHYNSTVDGMVGKITYEALKYYGFKG